MRISIFILAFGLLGVPADAYAQDTGKQKPDDPKTIFQTSAPWNAAYDIRSDAIMIYGARNNFEQRMQS